MSDYERPIKKEKVLADLKVGAQTGLLVSTPLTGIKHDQEKPQLGLLPIEAIEAVGRVMTFGAKKYEADNWRAGFKYRRTLGAALRHIFAFIRGEDLDPESGESHLAHAACCILFTLTFVLEKREELDDRYKREA